MSELQDVIEEIGNSFVQFKAGQRDEMTALKKQMDTLETFLARGQFTGGGSSRDGVQSEAARVHKDKFLAWVRKGVDGGLRDLEINAGLSTLVDPDGGFLVPVEIDSALDRLAIKSLAMRRLAKIVVTQGEYARPLSALGASCGWVAEKSDRAETDTSILKMFAPVLAEAYALPEITQKLLDMAGFDVVSWITEEINIAMTELEGAGFIKGNGVGQPKGILAYDTVADASWTPGKVGYIASGHASQINDVDKLVDLQHSLKPIYRQNGTFLMNDATLATIRKFKDGDGNYIWRPGLADNAPDTLLGKPIEIDDNMPNIGAGAFPIAYADFQRAYTIVDHVSGIRMLRDPYTKKGFVKFYTVKRVTGGLYNHQAVKLLKIASA